MKVTTKITAIVCLLFSLNLAAETSNIGVVNWREALIKSKAAKTTDANMQRENKKLLDRAKELERLLESDSKTLKKDKDILSKKEKIELDKKIALQYQEYDALRYRLNEIRQKTEADFILSQRANIDKAMKRLADKYKLDYILERSVIIYAREARNLTKELIEELNKLQ